MIAKLSQNLNGAFSEREKQKSPEAGKKLRRFEERARETDLRLEYTQKLQIILKIEHKGLKFPVLKKKKTGNPSSKYIKVPLYREKTVAIKTHETAINRPVDHTGET